VREDRERKLFAMNAYVKMSSDIERASERAENAGVEKAAI